MIHFEREVFDPVLIEEMLKQFQHVNIAMNDEDGYPYVVPVNYGFEIKNEKLLVYVHCMKRGKKVDLLRKDPRVCLEFSAFNDFPDRPYKGHRHDYRSVIAKGVMRLVDAKDEYETFRRGYELLYVCNDRPITPLESRKGVPNMYIGKIECDWNDVTAKSEFPLRTREDVQFVNVYEVEEDTTPFDIRDLIVTAKERQKKEK